jgi:hypothetical protein
VEGAQVERKIIDYQSHQYRLTPLLAQSFAYLFVQKKCHSIYDDMIERIQKVTKSFNFLEKRFLNSARSSYDSFLLQSNWNTPDT